MFTLQRKLIIGLIVLAAVLGFTGCPNPAAPAVTYTVTYDGNGNTSGSVPVGGNAYEEGQTVTVLGNTGNLVKAGYAFAGWNTVAGGSGTDYTDGTTFTMGTADIILYAKWGGSGYQETCTADGVSFSMIYVPGGITLPTGTDDSGTATVSDGYWVGETEVTYELWYTVHDWALSNSYNFANPGIEGEDGTLTDPAGAVPTAAKQEPVTGVNWRDSMVWCNALTEWYNVQNGTTLTPVYTYGSAIIRDSQDSNATACDGAVANATANGFRLLTSNEWELAARWRNDSINTVSGYTDPYFTKGNSASGATTYYNDTADTNPPNGIVDGKDANDLVAVYGYYYDVLGTQPTGVIGTAAVKSKAADSLGLYDMSANVWEWCFDLSGTLRVLRGGSWFSLAIYQQVGYVNLNAPITRGYNMCFRFSRTE